MSGKKTNKNPTTQQHTVMWQLPTWHLHMDDSDKVSVCIEFTWALANSPTVSRTTTRRAVRRHQRSAGCTCSQERTPQPGSTNGLGNHRATATQSGRWPPSVWGDSRGFNVFRKFRKYVMNEPTIGPQNDPIDTVDDVTFLFGPGKKKKSEVVHRSTSADF